MTNEEQLTPLDLLMPRTYTRLLLTFQTTATVESLLPQLQNAIDSTCEQVPWLAGKVFPSTSTETKKPTAVIKWDKEQASSTVIDLGSIPCSYQAVAAEGLPLNTIPDKIWPAEGFVNDVLCEAGAPALVAGLARFEDGHGVGLCVCLHHHVGDAGGFAEILRILASSMSKETAVKSDMTGRLDRLSTALSSDLDAVSSMAVDDVLSSHKEYTFKPPSFGSEFPSCTSMIINVPLTRINKYKDLLAKSDTTTTTSPPSANTILCALLWSVVTRVRRQRNAGIFSEGISRLGMAVNGRSRISSSFSVPERPYLGNVNLYSVADLSVDELTSFSGGSSSAETLARICAVITASNSPSKINAQHIAETFHLGSSVDDFRALNANWSIYNGPDLTITSWANLGLYELDFGPGLGRPEFVRIPYVEWDSLCIVLPRKKVMGGGGNAGEDVMEVVMMSRRDDLEALGEDVVWKSFVG